MAKKKELTVEERLRALYDLQLIDSRIDEIRNVRGELPLEVRDLEDDVEGFNLRVQKLEDSMNDVDGQIKSKKNLIEEAKGLIKKYTEQQKNVRNNREFNSLSKEVEFQELEIQLAEKHIKEFFEMEKKTLIDSGTETLNEFHHLAFAVVLKADLEQIKSVLKPNRGQIAK